MGAFYLLQRNKHPDEAAVLERLDACMHRQGFRSPVSASSGGVLVRAFGKVNVRNENYYRSGDDDWAVSAGTFVYDGRMGRDALKAALDTFTPAAPEWDKIYGHFCLILCRHGTVHVVLDRVGTYKVYASTDKRILSSSFLAVADAVKASAFSDQEVYEYVFQGATYGKGTIVKDVEILESSAIWQFGESAKGVPLQGKADTAGGSASFEDLVQVSLSNLRAYFGAIANCFPRIDTALSGGYDSRLCLALLREQGVTPRVHVYGGEHDPDVKIAKAIAAGERFPLEVIDKGRFPKVEVGDFPNLVERNFWSFDGYPADGIFDNGSDLASRLDRCANAEVMLNGGGGEIFRNFFYLPDRTYKPRELLWAFYSRFDPKVCGREFSEDRYFAALETKLRAAIGAGEELLSRDQVEAAYPMFRSRFWMGRNNSLNNRFGWALTPFAEHGIVKDTVAIPIKYKNFGAFEARLIEETDSRLAGYPSAYGHDFARRPPVKRVLKEMATLIRPTYLRRYSYRLQMRMKHLARPYFLKPPYLHRVIDPSFPVMSRFFDMDGVRDLEHYRRICTLEYLARRLSLE